MRGPEKGLGDWEGEKFWVKAVNSLEQGGRDRKASPTEAGGLTLQDRAINRQRRLAWNEIYCPERTGL